MSKWVGGGTLPVTSSMDSILCALWYVMVWGWAKKLIF